jgi:hypothetical protein
MPVVINEIEIIEPPPEQPAVPGHPAPPQRGGPGYEQLRLLLRDLDARQQRLSAD